MNFQEMKQKTLKLDTTHFCDASKKVRTISEKIHQIVNEKIFGYAFTVDSADNVDSIVEALEMSKPNDVLVISGNKSGKALAGEILATIAKRKNLSGIIIDGACRDVNGLKKVGLPFYAKTINPNVADAKKMGRFQIPITCGKVIVNPGDIIFGDENGLIAVTEKDFICILALAEAVFEKETIWLGRIKADMDLKDVFK